MIRAIWLAAVATSAMATSVAAQAPSGAGDTYRPPAKRIAPTDGLVAQLVPVGETPRLADGHPDLTGAWGADPRWDTPYPRFGIRAIEKLEPDQAVMQRGNAWNKPVYKPALWQKVYDTDYGKVVDDPAFHCEPQGVPRQGMPSKIVQTPKEIVLVNGDQVRFVPTDGRKRDPLDTDFDNYNGVPLGHWEGDTLVIDSVGFTDKTWFQWVGYFHSANMTVQERFNRKGNLLYYSFTVTDPDVLVRPWTSETFVRRLSANPLARQDEVAQCRENDSDQIVDPYFRG